MSNISKAKRNSILEFLNNLKSQSNETFIENTINEVKNLIIDKKYGLVWEEHEEEFNIKIKDNLPIFIEDTDKKIIKNREKKVNFLIEADNLEALYLLEKTHRNSVDCIYIDPPYNTGAKTWKYNNDYVDRNDAYKHSKFISFMNQRLRMARKLLKDDGALITTIDDNELANILLLLYEIYPDCSHTIITIRMNPGGTQGKRFSVTNEYAIVTHFKDTQIFRQKHLGSESYNLRRWGSTSNRYEGKTTFYPIILNSNNEIIGFGDVLENHLHPSAQVEILENGNKLVWPLDKNKNEKKWRYSRDSIEKIKNRLLVKEQNERIEIIIQRESEPPKTVWTEPEYNSEQHGSVLLRKIIGKGKFNYPKSLYATKDCLSLIVGGKKDAVILDFFSGSGTTMNAVNLLNLEDGGDRRCILVTNNEISEAEEKKLLKEGFKKGDYEWEKLGVAQNVCWPRTKNTINGVNEDGELLEGYYLSNNIKAISKKRNFTLIDYVDKNRLNKSNLKNLIALIGKTLPKNVIKNSMLNDNLNYIVSDNNNHIASILINDQKSDEWLKELENKNHITEFYIISDSVTFFNEMKNKVNSLLGDYTVEERIKIPMANGFDTNLKYLKCEWTNRKPKDYLLSNKLMHHVKEMIELQNGIEIDNLKNILILNKDDFNNYLKFRDSKESCNVWINQTIIFNNEELRVLNEYEYKLIPKEYFGFELTEVAE